ncbi:3-keto-5-aminohexanoate cleavage enzyme [Planifilum fulgidum]|jgi:3-keto-5-aminohexanoate cleavage enzyme|uniref:3-keto-5-aminohexanoate cleavage enzyme n=1 Tax=Planifilum fulgidum TaxID=201973 RepID=A0A1I2LLI5_9BACL|nr:3-keto-5-aminohexanoate cleavage protein [Planifilum fulgidum]MBO2496535.1 3-keto-5-aminohexanoate cleavage protein [Bacillota bacterium]MBO2531364.1 3-keto-5-aminohexanoate cleavage protein [Thermoactinomycetaceae bacterium]SFF79388.1 3-keto-5-aminohexanoate cleavage enzyme [Planifilum fulgidum]
MDKLIITAALVGAEVTREDTPHLPVTPEEIGQAAAEAREAGASIAHIHVRDADGKPSQDRELYRRAIEEIRKRCDIIIQVSTGGAVGMTAEERLQPVALRPEMATLTTGTVNFGDGVFLNPPREIEHFAKVMQEYGVRPEFEIFDVGMIRNALSLVKKGLVTGHLHFDFVMGVPGGIPATAENLLHLLRQLPEGATWTVAGVGRAQLPMAVLGIVLGGHVRVGLEDNIWYRKGQLATNAQLVARVVRIAREMDRDIATPDEARRLLGLSG